MPVRLPLPEHEVAALNARFEGRPPQSILRWVLGEPGLEQVAVASAFQANGIAVIHMAAALRPDVPILFLDTGFHFEETHAFRRDLADRLDLNVIELRGDHTPASQAAEFGERLYERDPDLCCHLNKVVPFSRALHGSDAWITALRRDSAPTRAATPIVEQYDLEPGRPMLKVNPIAPWTRAEVWAYLSEHDLPHHPLYDVGYAQVGCAPCTRLAFPGEGERGGRWDGAQKVECGLHARVGAHRA